MSLAFDSRVAVRNVVRRPGITLSVVVTLALGVGLNTAMFSLVDAILLHPLGVDHASGLVAVYEEQNGRPYAGMTLESYRALAGHTSTVDGLASYWTSSVQQTDGGRARDLTVTFVSDNYFAVLGVPAAVGRTMTSADPQGAGANSVLVLNDAFWRTAFGGNARIVGQTIHLRGLAFTVIGVAPPRFRGTLLAAEPDAWAPISTIPALGIDLLSVDGQLNLEMPLYSLVGRLRSGASIQRASAELNGLIDRDRTGDVGTAVSPARVVDAGVTVLSLNEGATIQDREALVRLLRLMLGVVVLTLLLACSSVANLLVLRGRERAPELGVRAALGASSARLTGQLFGESVLLAVAGGAAGVGVAYVALRMLTAFTLPGRIALDHVALGLNWRVLAFTCGVSIATALGFGLAPAVSAARVDVMDLLRQRNTRSTGIGGRGPLLALQVAISLMLLVGAALFLRSLRAGFTTDIGFDPKPIVAVTVVPRYDGRHLDNIRPYAAIISQMLKVPGVGAAAAGTNVPIGPASVHLFSLRPRTDWRTRDPHTVSMALATIMGDYFTVEGVPVVMGRAFSAGDGPASPRVLIVNQSAARSLWPGESPIGKQLYSFYGAATVVGVVRDTKYMTLGDDRVPFVYAPMSQDDSFGFVSFIARSVDPRAALVALRRTVADVAPNLKAPTLPGLGPRLVADQIASALAPQRFGATLLLGFALAALCVSAVGIYGTVAYAVAGRASEIAIRVALGARGSDVLALIVSESARSVVAGMVLGVAGIVLSTRLVAHFLFGVAPTDWVAFACGVAVVGIAALAAAFVPCVRALRIDPARAMRAE